MHWNVINSLMCILITMLLMSIIFAFPTTFYFITKSEFSLQTIKYKRTGEIAENKSLLIKVATNFEI